MLENKLEELKEEFLEKKVSLLSLDNTVTKDLDCSSIFEGDTREYLKEGFCYQYQDEPVPEGINFEFEVIEDNEDTTKIIVKVIDIYSV